MIQLYGMGSPNVVKVLIMLEEAGLAYEVVRVDVFAGEQFEPGFTALNPNGKVPVIIDRRDPSAPVTVFESGAILLYLSETTGLFWPHDLRARYAVMQWLMLQMAGLGPIAGNAIHFTRAVKDDSYGRMRFTNELKRLAGVLEDRLTASPYLAGSDYSVADIAVFAWVRTLKDFFAEVVASPAIARWSTVIAERPAVRRADAIASDYSRRDMAALRAADPAAQDRYFGRTVL